MQCPYCDNQSIVKNGLFSLQDGSLIQHYLCKACCKRFSHKTGTPMAGLRTSKEIVVTALKMRGEGMGVRASGCVAKTGVSLLKVAFILTVPRHRDPLHELQASVQMASFPIGHPDCCACVGICGSSRGSAIWRR